MHRAQQYTFDTHDAEDGELQAEADPRPTAEIPQQLSNTLTQFDPETQLNPTYTVILFGPRRSGKSVMMRYFLKCLRNKLDVVVAFIPTSDTAKEFQKHLPKCFVHPKFDLTAFQNVIAAQHDVKEIVEHVSERAKHDSSAPKFKLRNIGIVMDDCMFDKKAMRSEDMRWVFMNGRHDNMFFMNACQYLMDIGMDLRTQIDLVVAFPTTNPGMITRMRENLFTCFETDEELLDVFTNHINRFEALVFDRVAYEQKRPYLFWCKADLTCTDDHFMVGDAFFWRKYYTHFVRPTIAETSARIISAVQNAKERVFEQKLDGGAGASGPTASRKRSSKPASNFVRVAGRARKPAAAPRAAAPLPAFR